MKNNLTTLRYPVWNQIFNCTGQSSGGITTTYDENTGIMTMNGTMTNSYFQCGQFADDTIVSRNGHRIFTSAHVIRNDENLNIMYESFNQQAAKVPSSGYFKTGMRSTIWTCASTTSSHKNYMGFYIEGGAGTVINDLQVRIYMIDLTQMFGAGSEPTDDAIITWMNKAGVNLRSFLPRETVGTPMIGEFELKYGSTVIYAGNVGPFVDVNYNESIIATLNCNNHSFTFNCANKTCRTDFIFNELQLKCQNKIMRYNLEASWYKPWEYPRQNNNKLTITQAFKIRQEGNILYLE